MRRLEELEISCGAGSKVGVHGVCPCAEAAVDTRFRRTSIEASPYRARASRHPVAPASIKLPRLRAPTEPLADGDSKAGLRTGENSVGRRPERRLKHRSFGRRLPVR